MYMGAALKAARNGGKIINIGKFDCFALISASNPRVVIMTT